MRLSLPHADGFDVASRGSAVARLQGVGIVIADMAAAELCDVWGGGDLRVIYMTDKTIAGRS